MNIKLDSNIVNNNYFSNPNNIEKLKTDTFELTNCKTSDNINRSDIIEITEKNKTIINSKKAKDALNYTLSSFSGKIYKCTNGFQDISGVLADITILAKGQGIKTPLDPNFNMSNSVGKYIDDLMNFAIDLSNKKPEYVPMDFINFCKEYKNNLQKYDCK